MVFKRVLFCFVFVEAAALRSVVLRYICRRPGSHTVSFFSPFVYLELEMSLFQSIFCTIAVFSVYGEYVVRPFLPDDGVIYLCDHELDF